MNQEQVNFERNNLISDFLRIGHGNLSIYTDQGLAAAKNDPELLGHMIAWNSEKGEVRDSKVALPMLALRGPVDGELYENAAAALCDLSPRNLLDAYRYGKSIPTKMSGGGKWLKLAFNCYLTALESKRNLWNRTAVQHRSSLKNLYKLAHFKPADFAQKILFDKKYPKGSVFDKIANLKNLSAQEAAGTIINYNIPFLVASSAIGRIKKDSDAVLAIIESMSGAELLNNANMLKRMGAFENPALNAAFQKGIEEKTKKQKGVSTLKAKKASEVVKDKKLKKKLDSVQESKLQKASKIEGNWLILGDCSGSMDESIEISKRVSQLVSKQVKGDVYLVFFNHNPHYFDVTGLTLSEIEKKCKRIRSGGATSIGCGLDYIMERNLIVNGIVICSDGGENRLPFFVNVYKKYSNKFLIDPTVYYLHVRGERDVFTFSCNETGIPLNRFEYGRDVDYYSLPNILNVLKPSRYGLYDEVMETPLLTLSNVLYKRFGFILE